MFRFSLSILVSLLFLTSCTTTKTNKPTIYVSIAPLKYIVERITDTTSSIAVLVPETTSPETYEPTIQQIKDLSNSEIYISTGLLDFENALSKSISQLSNNLTILDLSTGIETIDGTCSHDDSNHKHGIDPHVWLSPKLVRQFSGKIRDLLSIKNPNLKDLYQSNYNKFMLDLDKLDSTIHSQLDSLSNRNFAIAHPSLTYYSKDYNLNQISIEVEGKEPSIKAMKTLINQLRQAKISRIFTQRQTSDAAAQTIANEIGAQVVEFDPLAENWLENIQFITRYIANGSN